MANEKNTVMVELYDLVITDKKDDRFGRVVTSESFSEDDLVHLAVQRRTDLNATTLRSSLDILKELAKEKLVNGASVNFGLGYFHLDVHGVFVGDYAKWDPAIHSLRVKVTPTVEVRSAVKASHVNVRGMAQSSLVINSITDVASGETNTRLTPGGGVNLAGAKIRIVGDSADNGIRLTDQASGTVTLIPANAILLNDPSKVSFVVPADLPAGDYRLSLTTQYSSGSNLLKDPRTFISDYVLTV
jgi:hypothetical protein